MRLADVLAAVGAVSMAMPTVAWAAPSPNTAAAPESIVPPPGADGGQAGESEPTADATGEPEPSTAPTPDDAAPDPDDVRFAAQVQAAQDHYAEAKALMSEGRYAAAAGEYERSFASVEFGDTLFKIIGAYDKAGEPVKALVKARQYLQLTPCEGGRETSANYPCREPEQQAQARADAERLRGLVGELRLKPSKGVVLREVRVADRIVPVSDFPIMLLPGAYVVSVAGAQADQLQSYDVEIDAGETYNLSVAPFPVQAPVIDGGVDPDPGIEDPGVDEARRKRVRRGVFWGGVAVTGLSGAATAILGGLAWREREIFNDEKCSMVCSTEEYETLPEDPSTPEDARFPKSHEERLDRLRLATNTMIGVTAAFGVVTVVVGIFAFSKKPTGANARVQVRRGGLAVRF